MADSAAPEAELTPEQRVDAAVASARFGQAGLGALGVGERMGTGGGGAGGQFVFADLAELDSVIGDWTAYRDRANTRVRKFRDAASLMTPMAGDMMSYYQARAAKGSLEKALDHEIAMFTYADAYVQKLTASRASMATTEQGNLQRLQNTGEGHR